MTEQPVCDPTSAVCPLCGATTRKDLSCANWKHVAGLIPADPDFPEPDVLRVTSGLKETFRYHSKEAILAYASARVAYEKAKLSESILGTEACRVAVETRRLREHDNDQ